MSKMWLLVLLLLGGLAQPAEAQGTAPLSATLPLQFESWRPEAPFDSSGSLPVARLPAVARDRKDRALIGGAIGAAAGLVFCTVMSTLIDDSADGGISFCPLDSYLISAGAGFAAGALIGWLTGRSEVD